MRQVVDRLKEPSTWLGFGALAALFGVNDAEWATYSQALAAVFAILGIILKEASASGQEKIDAVKRNVSRANDH